MNRWRIYRGLTQGKVAIWKHDVRMAHAQPWGMFTLIDSRRHRCD